MTSFETTPFNARVHIGHTGCSNAWNFSLEDIQVLDLSFFFQEGSPLTGLAKFGAVAGTLVSKSEHRRIQQ